MFFSVRETSCTWNKLGFRSAVWQIEPASERGMERGKSCSEKWTAQLAGGWFVFLFKFVAFASAAAVAADGGWVCVRLFFFPVAFQIRIISLCVCARRYFWWLLVGIFLLAAHGYHYEIVFVQTTVNVVLLPVPVLEPPHFTQQNVANKKSGYHFLFVLIYFEMLSTYAIHNTYANQICVYEYAAHSVNEKPFMPHHTHTHTHILFTYEKKAANNARRARARANSVLGIKCKDNAIRVWNFYAVIMRITKTIFMNSEHWTSVVVAAVVVVIVVEYTAICIKLAHNFVVKFFFSCTYYYYTFICVYACSMCFEWQSAAAMPFAIFLRNKQFLHTHT